MQTYGFSLVKLIEFKFFAIIVYFNPCLGPLPRIKISLFLLTICEDELISTPKIIIFLPTSLPTDKILLYQIQYYIQNIYTDQHQHVLLI